MMKFILLLYILNGNASVPMVAEFDSMAACEGAAKTFSEKVTERSPEIRSNYANRTVWTCNPKG